MMRCALTLILFLAMLLTSCTATPAMTSVRAAESLSAVAATVAATAPGAPNAPPTPTHPAVATTAAAAVVATAVPTATASVLAMPAPIPLPSPAPSTATATAEAAMVTLGVNANVRAGPGTLYPVIGGVQAGQTRTVTGWAHGNLDGQQIVWWRTAQGWVAGPLATPNAAAQTVPLVQDVPPLPTPTSVPVIPPMPPPLRAAVPDLVVLGPDTQYPVRARVIRGWDYEFVDLATQYDIVVYRDVFGMLAHQIDEMNRQRFGKKTRLGDAGPIRITLIDAQPHPDPGCAGWGWTAERATFSDPLGLMRNPCRVEHSLYPLGDGAGAVLLLGWSSDAWRTVAVGAGGTTLSAWSTTFFAEAVPWPLNLGPADRPDFRQALYQPLGQAEQVDGRWDWQDPFVQIMPAAG